MNKPEAAKSLGRWTLVHLDVDHSEGAAAMLQSGAIPLLRVLSPTGRRVDFKEGTMSAAELVKWLDGQYERAVEAAGEELLGNDAPDAAATAKLIADLAESDAALRESAIKRLAPHRKETAVAVVDAFAKANLVTRLACLDLLTEWKAPVDGLDPWQPETLSAERLKRLKDWAAGLAKVASTAPTSAPSTKPVVLTPEQLQEARREMDRLVAAATPAEARGLRERLARLGKVLLPKIRTRLNQQSRGETAHRRLLELRYRVAASDALAWSWPGGLERLASADPSTRHAAAEELVAHATPDDGPLFLELFADSDSLVREISLRGLQAVGKGAAGRALEGLLNDPDLNVRAAVLKQLAESPSAAMVGPVIEFAKKESDPDLVVHAVRVLRHAKSDAAVDGLLALLGHGSWRVRAEAAEALGEITRESDTSPARKADVNVAMIKLLDDPDGFVVSRAVTALAAADVATAVEPLAKVAKAHPELAPDVIRMLIRGTRTRFPAQGHLREFCTSKDPRVRAEAIAGLVVVSGDVEKEMKALLKDGDESVRNAAAASLFRLVNSWRPDGRPTTRTEGGFFGFGGRTVEVRNDPGEWAANFRAGKMRPMAWLSQIDAELRPLTTAKDARTRLNGALALLALTTDDKPLEVIRGAVRDNPQLADAAAGALPWLGSDQRVSLFEELAPLAARSGGRHGGIGELVESMAIVRDVKAAPALWKLLGAQESGEGLAGEAYRGLFKLYTGADYFSSEGVAADVRKRVVDEARAHLGKGSETQRLVALALLMNVSLPDAAEAAAKIEQDKSAPESLRADAFQIRLLAGTKADATKAAVAALSSPLASFRGVGVRYLATGADDLQYLRDEIYLSFNNPEIERSVYITQNTPIDLSPPRGVTVEMIKPLLGDRDPVTAADAAYLLALLGDRAGLDVLTAQWRASKENERYRRLLYRAIAALRDEDLAPLLEEIYASYERADYYVREFYWTTHVIGGERALKLRKKIRDEVGMQRLR
jgi:HEAT repeat protein